MPTATRRQAHARSQHQLSDDIAVDAPIDEDSQRNVVVETVQDQDIDIEGQDGDDEVDGTQWVRLLPLLSQLTRIR